MHQKTLLGNKGKGQTFAVKLNVENESVSICLEQGNTAVFNIANRFIISNEQYIIVYWDQHTHTQPV